MENKHNLDFSKNCRTCGKESKFLRNLLDVSFDGRSIANLINICTRVRLHVDDTRPKSICMSCITKLNTAYEFYNLVKNSEQRFEELISKQLFVKAEINDSMGCNEPKSFEKFEVIELKPTKQQTLFCSQLNKLNGNLKTNVIKQQNSAAICDKPSTETKKSNIIDTLNVLELFERRGVTVRKTDPELKRAIVRNPHIKKPNAKFECFQCKINFPTLQKVRAHLRGHDELTKCRICLKKCTRCEYVQHLCQRVDIDSQIMCQYCSQPFKSIFTLIKHINSNHKDHHNYKCYKCSKAFPMKVLLEIHKPTHDEEEKSFVCDICNSSYRTRFQIKEHIETAHTDRRSYLCSTCGKCFNNPTTLRSHMMRHTPTKPVACPKCPKRFFDKHGLKKHIEVHDDARFVCDICGSVMRSKSSYMEHKRRHTKVKVFTCEVCSKQIKTSLYNLKLHMYTHTGMKPFKCQYCDRCYTQNADLNKHLRTHVGQNTYKCNMCDQSFRLLCDLRKHTSEHYQQNLANAGIASMTSEAIS